MFVVESHGTSGRWHSIQRTFETILDALNYADAIKRNGFGVRIVRVEDESIAMNAPWQIPIDWSVKG